ncbi:hypothetical protein B484DRAFT_469994, partial [Ochromonadaceae sp. CCMP2298]
METICYTLKVDEVPSGEVVPPSIHLGLDIGPLSHLQWGTHQLIDAVVLALAPQLLLLPSLQTIRVSLRRAQAVQDLSEVRAVPIDEEVPILPLGQSVLAREHAPDHRVGEATKSGQRCSIPHTAHVQLHHRLKVLHSSQRRLLSLPLLLLPRCPGENGVSFLLGLLNNGFLCRLPLLLLILKLLLLNLPLLLLSLPLLLLLRCAHENDICFLLGILNNSLLCCLPLLLLILKLLLLRRKVLFLLGQRIADLFHAVGLTGRALLRHGKLPRHGAHRLLSWVCDCQRSSCGEECNIMNYGVEDTHPTTHIEGPRSHQKCPEGIPKKN